MIPGVDRPPGTSLVTLEMQRKQNDKADLSTVDAPSWPGGDLSGL